MVVEDLITGKRHNLNDSVYPFMASSTLQPNRFILYAIDANKAETLISEGNYVVAYLNQSEIVIESLFISGPIQIRVYDIAGRIVARFDGEMNQELRFPAPAADGVLIIEAQHSGGTERIKLTTAN